MGKTARRLQKRQRSNANARDDALRARALVSAKESFSGDARDAPGVARARDGERAIANALLARSCVDACVALDAMFARGETPKLRTCERVLALCQERGKAKPALRALARMDASERAKPSVIALRSVFFACAKRGMVDDALGLMKSRVDGDKRRALGMDVLVRACAMCPGGADGDLGLILLESALRGVSFGSWTPGTRAMIRAHAPFALPRTREDDDAAVSAAPARAARFSPESFKVVSLDDGRRRPADRLPLLLFAPTHAGVLPLEPSGLTEAVRHDVPHVSGAFAIANVLSRNECAAIIEAGKTIGLRTDPKDMDSMAPEASRLQYCEFVVWPQTSDVLWRRVSDLMPTGAVGINARWRFFRYGPGTIYRRHVDGSWPAGGLDENGEYVVDVSKGKVRSRLTFLIYLTEGFAGGATTFYTASGEPGVISARGVQPQIGAALCFPHGDAENSPIHEGSAVDAGIAGEQFKYIIRTDVMFDVSSTSTAHE